MRRYVDYCFYGLLLIFLDLNFNGQVGQVDLLSDALGIWLVAYGLYALQRVDQRLQRAFYWSLLYLLVDVIWEVSNWAGWLKFYPLLGGGMTVLVIGLMLLTFYEMLGGLSWEAEKSGLNELGETLERWRGYMVVIYLAGHHCTAALRYPADRLGRALADLVPPARVSGLPMQQAVTQ